MQLFGTYGNLGIYGTFDAIGWYKSDVEDSSQAGHGFAAENGWTAVITGGFWSSTASHFQWKKRPSKSLSKQTHVENG